MKQLKIEPYLTAAELRKLMKKAKTKDEFRRWQCIYLASTMDGIPAEYISMVLGISKSLVYNYVQSYNRRGKEKYIPSGKKNKSLFIALRESVNG